MRRLGLSVPRSSARALWLGRTMLAACFCGLLIGGAVRAPEALVLSFAAAAIAGAGWLFARSPVPLRRLGPPALAWAATLIVAGFTAAPLASEAMRSGLYAAVGGNTLSIAPEATLIEMAKLSGLGCAFLCGVFSGCGRRTPAKLLDACIVLTASWGAWSLVLFVLSGSEARLSAPLGSPNTAATFLGIGVVLATGRLLALLEARIPPSRKQWAVVWVGCSLVLTFFALCLTQSRAGLVVVSLAASALLLSWPAQVPEMRRAVRWFGAAACVLTGLILLQAGGGALMRLPGLIEDAADRREIFGLYWRAFLDAPVFGAGLGASTYVVKLGLTPENYGVLWNVQSAHNWALQWLAEGGLAGALPMACAVAAVLAGVVRGLSARSAPVVLPLLFADVLVLGHGLTDFALQIPAVALYWSFLLGLQTAVAGRQSPPPSAGGVSSASSGDRRS